MKTIEYLPHLADIRVRIEADTLDELFEAGLKGMTNILKKDFCSSLTEFRIEYNVEIKSNDVTALLVDFLSDVLTKSYVDRMLFCELSVSELTAKSLIATVYGTRADGFDEDIKAITYHEADVKQNNEGKWETLLIFDI
ncbi:MAG TPA: archease [Chitinophagales bacterium]|nr:archease [Chitinophagales bacterium]